jgi:PelA/Pel-15E family pectate lyase
MKFKPALCLLLALGCSAPAFAAVIGTNIPATPLTAQRVAGLPAWKIYFENSQRQRATDQEFLRAETTAHGLATNTAPKAARNATGIALNKWGWWYGHAEARQIADNLISFQTPAGGWCKNTDYTRHQRAPGEMFGAEAGSLFPGTDDFDEPRDARWDYVGTFDNDATTTELRFLAKVIAATGTNNTAYRESFRRGLGYIFAAQFPNGGWPQVWPLQGGYHDAVTFNDDAMLHIMGFLRDVAGGQNDFSFVPAGLRAQADASWKHGLDCILAAQIVADGRRTAWCQQYDAITLQPASARNYEMPSAASSESATIFLFLMQLPDPDTRTQAAIRAAGAWFQKTKIEGQAFKPVKGKGRELVAAPGSVVWGRYYEIGTDKPIFGDRDKTIHDAVSDISPERRNGYGWYRDTPKRVLEQYAKWLKTHPQPD